VPGSFTISAHNSDGTLDGLASSHPDSFTLHFELNTEANGHTEGGRLRNVLVKLPPGLVGNPNAVPACSLPSFENEECPPETQVGVLRPTIYGTGQLGGPVYNLVPPPGVATEIGFERVEFVSQQFASVLSEEGYGVEVSALDLPLEISAVTETIWGVPAKREHDRERGIAAFDGSENKPEASTAPVLPYLTLPATCDAAPKATIEIDSVREPTHYLSYTTELQDAGGNPSPLIGCDAVPFTPAATLKPTTAAASTATGFNYKLKLPEQNLLNPAEGVISETEPRQATIKLPLGMTVNPSMAVGIGVCTEAQFASEQIDTASGAGCPESSKIGDISAQTPVIDEQIEGAMYLATPYANPAKTLVAAYIVARARERGVLIKQFGRIDLDPSTGQITATFDGLPPLPYSGLQVTLREGSRAPLVTPALCGRYVSEAGFTPFSAPGGESKVVESAFQIERGVDNGPCPAGGLPPFAPSLTAGTINNAAGHYSPLYLRIERQDGEQEITGFATQLPPGLSGNLTGVPFCDPAAIQRAREQTGGEAEASPACPQASKIGHTIAEAGVGGILAQAQGNLYLSGPFEGAPFSIVSVTAAKVGPFDLGTVVVHLPLNIDPVTAQVSIPSGPADQIPHILKGVVIHLRAIDAWIDRSSFTLNPTSCQTLSLNSTVDGAGADVASAADDTTATVHDRFQAAECANLGFKPSFKASTSAKTSRKNGASLKVKLTYPSAPQGSQANIRAVKVDLPKQLPSRLTTLQQACTSAQFEADPAGCPAASRVGEAVAFTPILPVPLAGPAYFVSHGGAKFPELILVLQGYGVTIDLHGETFISKAGITSSTFHSVPDQPVTSFELTLPQGPNSALAANGNLCASSLKMPTQFNGQNGAIVKQSTPISVSGCPKKKAKHKAKKSGRAGGAHGASAPGKKK
jgi:hypothetical protein